MKKRISCALLTALTLALGLTACGGTKDTVKDIDLSDTWDAMEEKMGENLPMLQEVEDENLTALYGISPEDLEDYELHIAMMNVKADEYFVAKVKDGKLDAVKEAIDKRAKMLDEQWSTYLPDQHELVKNYVLVDKGNYVFFAIGEQAEELKSVFEESFQ